MRCYGAGQFAGIDRYPSPWYDSYSGESRATCNTQNVSNLSILQCLENEATRSSTIRFICGARKKLLVEEPKINTPAMKLMLSLDELYHAIGHEARCEAFEEGRAQIEQRQTPALLEKPEPVVLTKPLISGDSCDTFIREYANTDDEDELEFTFAEVCDAVMDMYLERGKYQWDAHAGEMMGSNMPRWQNSVQSSLQRLKANGIITYSKKRQSWVIL